MKNVDIVFVTNLPSFYKIELYNQIASKKIMVFLLVIKHGRETMIFFVVTLNLTIYISKVLFL